MASGSSVAPSASSTSLPHSFEQADRISPHAAAQMCHESTERVQLVADLLLLQSGGDRNAALLPVSAGNESFGKSRDAIVANTKGLAISIKEFSKLLHHKNLAGVYRVSQQVAEQVIILTEASAHAAYFAALTDPGCEPASPPPVDRYAFSRAIHALKLGFEKFRLEYGPLSRTQIMSLSRTFADNLALVTQGCKMAGENKKLRITDRVQFSHCAQAIQAATTAFLPNLKAFATSVSTEDRKRCILFGKPLLEIVNSVEEFSRYPQFAGKPARLSEAGHHAQTEILAGAMAIVGSSIQLLNTGQRLVEPTGASGDAGHWQKLVRCTKAVADATKFLSSSLRVHTPLPSLLPSRSTSLETFLH